jgi:hypothetical protein
MGRFEDRLLEELLHDHGQALAGAERPGRARKRHAGRWVAAVGTVAAVASGVLVVQTVGDQPAVPSAAAEVLTDAADKLGASDPVVRPGQYLYVESHEWGLATTDTGGKVLSYLQESVIQTWVPHDRSEEWLRRSHNTDKREWIQGSEADLTDTGDQGVEELRARCGDFYPEGGIPEGGGMRPCEREGGWEEPTPEFVATLPSDPQQLHDRIREAMAEEGTGPDLAMLDFVQDAIGRGLLPAELRANLYRALALMPALKVSDRDANLDGRTGVGLGIEGAGRRHELIIDPATGQFIGERETAIRGGQVPAGTVMYHTSLSTSVVDEAGR